MTRNLPTDLANSAKERSKKDSGCNKLIHIPHLQTYTGHWFHKHHRPPVTLEIFLHLIETNIFEKITLDQVVANAILGESDPPPGNQQILL